MEPDYVVIPYSPELAYMQRTEPRSASDTPLRPHEKVILRLYADCDRLQAALRQIQQWDCLNPPNPELCSDHPWLKRLVDEALSGGA